MKNHKYTNIIMGSYIDEFCHMFDPPKKEIELTDFFKEYCDEMNDFRNLYKIKYPKDNIILCHNSKPISIDYKVYLPARASFIRYYNLF